jgi:hypothetical protein
VAHNELPRRSAFWGEYFYSYVAHLSLKKPGSSSFQRVYAIHIVQTFTSTL